MTRDEFLSLEAAGEAVLLDIREPFELAVVPSPARAIHIPLSRFGEARAWSELPQDKLIVTVCQSGGRCGPANAILLSQGFSVAMIDGGLSSWG